MKALDDWKKTYPEKFASEEVIIGHIHRDGVEIIADARFDRYRALQGHIRY